MQKLILYCFCCSMFFCYIGKMLTIEVIGGEGKARYESE